MSSHLSKDLRTQHNVRAMPIRKGDEVQVMRGTNKTQAGKVITVYRRKFAVHIEKLVRTKPNGQTVPIPVHPSNLLITKLKMDKDRKNLINRKASTILQKKDKKWSKKDLVSVD